MVTLSSFHVQALTLESRTDYRATVPAATLVRPQTCLLLNFIPGSRMEAWLLVLSYISLAMGHAVRHGVKKLQSAVNQERGHTHSPPWCCQWLRHRRQRCSLAIKTKVLAVEKYAVGRNMLLQWSFRVLSIHDGCITCSCLLVCQGVSFGNVPPSTNLVFK